ncbi:hypothetical protein [Natronorubrum thiooxidans]|uniref:DUF8053 domain-containing protein n=1 Tax=Natronorubrum thiooxidans TaxID=308853 RepID=A0A1N7GJ31_9EURY|nr:hypothetical protein [Natronorubrum thiooxidans]SIS12601.1 hypothetical protein SAMN05421752_112136 [Natronorubrum thiooxidans]
MALHTLRQLDQDSVGITLPKDDVRLEGLLDEHGRFEGEHHVHIRHEGEGEWSLELIEEIDLDS